MTTAGSAFFGSVTDTLRRVSLDEFGQAVQLLEAARDQRRRVYAIGNGGSAATASHLACDLTRPQPSSGGALAVFALTDNTAVLTARGNDEGYHQVFATQLAVLLEPDDVVVAITVSGRSPNVVAGLRTARAAGARSIGLLGADGGAARGLVDVALLAPSTNYGVVESVHLAVVHAMAAALGTARGTVPAADPAAGPTPDAQPTAKAEPAPEAEPGAPPAPEPANPTPHPRDPA